MGKTEIRIGGFGGQGVILSGFIIGKASAIFDSRFATMIQSFGPEARGGACNAQVIISDTPVLYPYITIPNILVIMSQEAYNKFGSNVKRGGTILFESDLVKVNNIDKSLKVYSIPATHLAEELGRKIVLNIVMVGFFTAVTNIVSYDSIKKSILDSVPKGTETININAFEKGFQYGKEILLHS
jgi:2-oxoglutarate ferredoxin oxidoreductase subunit gamma